jgi:D-arabinose 1-dehydrogenase-like Zn-dependent alcohol dehydrogenase
VIAMARKGSIHTETTEFPLEEAPAVYDPRKAGQIAGRAVPAPQAA